jgi:hypothetical protein
MALQVTDSMLIKARYELQEFQEDDSAGDIVQVIIDDESFDEYTRGYLTAKLEQWGNSLDGEDLLAEFIDFIERILALKG